MKRIRYRRSPSLIAYWQGERVILHNYATNRRITVTPIILEVLSALEDWHSVTGVASRFGLGRQAAKSALERLHGVSLLQRSDRRPSRADRALTTWKDWSPEAAFFHLSTKNVPYKEPDVSETALRAKATLASPPPPVKRFEKAPRVALPAVTGQTAVARTLLKRRTWRRFARQPVEAGELATLLGLTWGVVNWVEIEGQGRVALKTAPSGGARHSLEAYALVQNVRGLKPGLYHYDAEGHALEWLTARAKLAKISDYVPHQRWYDAAAAVVFMTAVFARAQWRYPYSRAYRSVLLEAGHFCQTFCLLATSLNLAPFCTAAFAETRLERDLGIDGVTESVIYACGVGTRPDGVAWAPWPDTTDVPALLPPKSARKPNKA